MKSPSSSPLSSLSPVVNVNFRQEGSVIVKKKKFNRIINKCILHSTTGLKTEQNTHENNAYLLLEYLNYFHIPSLPLKKIEEYLYDFFLI